jgi:hypothetical protein
MSETPVSARMLARATNANPLRKFPQDAMQVSLVTALRHAFDARKREEKMTQEGLGRRSRRDPSAVSRVLSGRDWRMNSIADLAEALDLRLEFAFVDRRNPGRRFTRRGEEHAPAGPEVDAGALAAAGDRTLLEHGEREALNTLRFGSSGPRLKFSSASMGLALVTALRHSFKTRKAEYGWTQTMLGKNCGRRRSSITATLAGRDWKVSTISDLAEGLGLRLEFAFVDKWKPGRRFTARGVEYSQSPSTMPQSGPVVPA